MKRKLKYLLLLLIVITIGPTAKADENTYTETFNDKYMFIPEAYVDKKHSDGYIEYQQLSISLCIVWNQLNY